MSKRPATLTDRGAGATAALARAIARARIARRWSRSDLAQRARVSAGSVRRVEEAEAGVALWVWLNVMESLGLMGVFERLDDPATNALLDASAPKRARARRPKPDLDF